MVAFFLHIIASAVGTICGILLFAVSFEIWNTKIKKIVRKKWPGKI